MIYTFYSYKGGVGRSMALANAAEYFCLKGYRVLIVDWDLEAPGIEKFFNVDQEKTLKSPGVLDMILDYKRKIGAVARKSKFDHPVFLQPESCAINISAKSAKSGPLYLITAGRRSEDNGTNYSQSILNFNWKEFYDKWDGENYFEWLRKEFQKLADVVLIDSRTGVTEMGGVCTHQMADAVLLFCTPSNLWC